MKLILALMIAVALTACGEKKAEGPSFKEQRETQVSRCIGYGVAYFKEIDAYPKLHDGRSADVVAKERCERQPATAFTEPKPFCIDYAKRDQIRKEQASNPKLLKALEQTWKEQEEKYPVCNG